MINAQSADIIISNITLIEQMIQAATEVDTVLITKLDQYVKEWAKKNGWQGIFDFYGDQDLWVAPGHWKHEEDEAPNGLVFWGYEEERDEEFCVTGMTGQSNNRYGWWLQLDAEAITGLKGAKARKALAAWLAELRADSKLVEAGFEAWERWLFLPVVLSAGKLAEDWPEIDEALEPVGDTLDRIRSVMPVIEGLIRDACAHFGTSESFVLL